LLGEGEGDRKQWFNDRIEELAQIFSIAVGGFSVTDNHLHVLVRLDAEVAAAWSDEEVVRRWGRLFPPRDKKRQPLPVTNDWVQWRLKDAEWVSTTRQRLQSLSWFMKCLKTPHGPVPSFGGSSTSRQAPTTQRSCRAPGSAPGGQPEQLPGHLRPTRRPTRQPFFQTRLVIPCADRPDARSGGLDFAPPDRNLPAIPALRPLRWCREPSPTDEVEVGSRPAQPSNLPVLALTPLLIQTHRFDRR
jgi:hypothetical protein